MIFTLSDTDTRQIAKKLVTIREAHGQATTGRVLTLIVVADPNDDIEAISGATADASREHPSRVLVMVPVADEADKPSLDAEIRVGGHAGATEMVLMTVRGGATNHLAAVVTPLLLPDTPIVAWWPSTAPKDLASDPIGRLAQRRITDCQHTGATLPLQIRRDNYAPGDSDMAWSRITPWRGVVASTLDQPPHDEISSAAVWGPAGNPSVCLAAGWLADRFGLPVTRHNIDGPSVPVDDDGNELPPIHKLVLERNCGAITVVVTDHQTLTVTNNATGRSSLVPLNRRSVADCLTEEMRHLAPDNAYAKALRALGRVTQQ
ncbi:glucose-6-phosphate dehydrogenase assembly protein OpcA [Corynebacterium mendelii]|uniref:Glucose-6-phosphate dehydrogenase assembly protein OpcA n=1 Tax=Corynebacterium mendelii TaxID=2765362 RepID=A0A939E067_9CORY|nr:glucose-6-phosphate dehydrogenase assembly protein OpcA [Corynebacterium mendelii]MBN9643443.1 glucose-6-phosphate dehydrogenase assembly protein OpcA [Corynebacterium mendelii]